VRQPIPVVIFDEHASVLADWFERGVRGRTQICFDAHLDWQAISTAHHRAPDWDEIREKLAHARHLRGDPIS